MKKNFTLTALIAIILLTTSFPCWAQANNVQVKKSYDWAKSALQAHFDRFCIDDNPLASESLDREWSLLGQWAANHLNKHPSSRPNELESAIKKFAPDLNVSVVDLAPRTFVVATSQGETGNVFIVTARDGQFKVAWNIKQSAQTAPNDMDILAAWSIDGARDTCRGTVPDKSWDKCGPLYGRIGKLPDTEKGDPRFYIDATYAQPAGLTVEAQLSIWTLHNEIVMPLLVRRYTYLIDQTQGFQFDGNFLLIRTKDELKTFSTCGSCEGRQMDWTIRVTPQTVEDLGKKSTVQELDLIDELYYRIEHEMPADDLAFSAVIEAIRPSVEELRKESPGEEFPSLGMLAQRIIERKGGARELCFSTDEVGPYLFSIELINGSLYVSDVKNFACGEYTQ